jgi:uncharacterized protein involved in exopolysaccharide biosynthesis
MNGSPAAPAGQEIDDGLKFVEFARFIWTARAVILIVTGVCVAAAGAASWLVPSRYEGTILLLPSTGQTPSAGLGALASVVSQLGGVASLAGLNLSGGSGAKAEAVATLQSQAIIETYIRDHDLLPVLFSRQWDSGEQKWRSADPKKIPTLWKGMDYFKKNVLNVTENAKTGLVSLTVTWKEPHIAAAWANGLVKLTNDYLRDKAIRESQRNIDYLNGEALKMVTVEIRTAIFTVMESEIKKEMVAKGSEEYGLKVIDPALAPEKKSFPQPGLWIAGGLFLGLVFGVVAAVARSAFRTGTMSRM